MNRIRKIIHDLFPSGVLSETLTAQQLAEDIIRVFSNKRCITGEPLFEYIQDVLIRLSELTSDVTTLLTGAVWFAFREEFNLAKQFRNLNDDVITLAQRVCRIESMSNIASEDVQAEQFRHLILSLAKDIRVIFIILVDRAHTLANIEKYPTPNPQAYARSVAEIYAPLANRLGIGKLKSELEDLSFRILNPKVYAELKRKVAIRRADKIHYLDSMKAAIQKKLEEEKISATIRGRVKHLKSIYNKMLKQGIPFDEVYDVVGMRIITDSIRECYTILGLVHSLWKPVPHRFKDFIAIPKKNMYQSIHTTVIGPSALPLEVQIRTAEMDKIAEIGIAAHWRYKESFFGKKYESKFFWLRQIMQWMRDNEDASELLEALKIDLFPNEVFVFTPTGEIRTLSAGATVIDFAYQIHTDIGSHCRGAKVNNIFVPIKTELRSGDVVEILTSPRAHPRADWLSFVKTPAAKSKIRRYLRDKNRNRAILSGRETLKKLFRRKKLWSAGLMSSVRMQDVGRSFGFLTREDLFAAIGFGKISAEQVINRYSATSDKPDEKILIAHHKQKKASEVKVGNMKNLLMRFARCCEPLPGEEIIGYITSGKGITIHAKRCSNLRNLEQSRIVDAQWEKSDQPAYPVRIVFQAYNLPGLLQKIYNIFTQYHLLMLSQKTEVYKRKKNIRGEFKIEIPDMQMLNKIFDDLGKLPGMINVGRLLVR